MFCGTESEPRLVRHRLADIVATAELERAALAGALFFFWHIAAEQIGLRSSTVMNADITLAQSDAAAIATHL